jgi:uncharacterized protein (TIGR03067 family)
MSRLFVVFLAVAAGTFVSAADPAEKKEGDLAKLAGTWKTMAGPNKDVPLTLKIEGKKATATFTTPEGDEVTMKGEVKLDETVTPKTIDFVNFKRPDGEDTQDTLGIYTFDGDELRVCNGGPGEGRPKEFKEGDGGPPNVLIFKREAAAAK